MSIPVNDYEFLCIAEQRARDCQREAEIDRMLSEVRPHSDRWWSRLARRLERLLSGLRARPEVVEAPSAALQIKQDVVRGAASAR